jgi:hypothetical protein
METQELPLVLCRAGKVGESGAEEGGGMLSCSLSWHQARATETFMPNTDTLPFRPENDTNWQVVLAA